MEIGGLDFPLDRKYHKSHLWVKPDVDTVRIGIDAFLADKAGFINFLTIDKKDAKEGESIGSLESGKFVSKIYAPVGGKIVDINQAVVNNPKIINDNPYDAWFAVIQPDKATDSTELFGEETVIKDWIEGELKKYEEEQS